MNCPVCGMLMFESAVIQPVNKHDHQCPAKEVITLDDIEILTCWRCPACNKIAPKG